MKPLADLRIIAIEQYGAGPFGSLHLADLGAEVIKIEEPRSGGDVGRYVPPYQEAEESLFFESFNRNKRSISLDLMSPGGRKIFEDLVARSDAVYSNLRGDLPEKMKLGYTDLRHKNPAVVCCSLSGYGMTGPRRDQPAYDYLLQGIAGWMSITGAPDGPPTKSGLSLVDFIGGYVAALSLMIGIHAARRDGVGMDCDVSLFDAAMGMLTYPATWLMTAGWQPERTRDSSHPSLVPFQNFETADGWIVIACAKQKFWERLCVALDRSDLTRDVRFETFDARFEHKQELVDLLGGIFRTKPSQEWLRLLEAARVPVAPVNSLNEALSDPQTSARSLIAEYPHPVWGSVRQVASPVRVGDATRDYRAAPSRGQDTQDVLTSLLGYSQDEIVDLEGSGAFG